MGSNKTGLCVPQIKIEEKGRPGDPFPAGDERARRQNGRKGMSEDETETGDGSRQTNSGCVRTAGTIRQCANFVDGQWSQRRTAVNWNRVGFGLIAEGENRPDSQARQTIGQQAGEMEMEMGNGK